MRVDIISVYLHLNGIPYYGPHNIISVVLLLLRLLVSSRISGYFGFGGYLKFSWRLPGRLRPLDNLSEPATSTSEAI
jgi:hypothetical protein